jgi:hypothetical protein
VKIHLKRVVSALVGGTNSCTPAPSKELISTLSRRADSGPNRNNLFSTRQIREQYQNVLVSFLKRYRTVCPFVFDCASTYTKELIHTCIPQLSYKLACKVKAIPIYRLGKTSVRANYLALPFLFDVEIYGGEEGA